jgi:hypothetical protein
MEIRIMKLSKWSVVSFAAVGLLALSIGAGPRPMVVKGTGTIELTVTDSGGAAVPEINVKLQKSALGIKAEGGAAPIPGGGRTAGERMVGPFEDIDEQPTDKEGKVTFKELEAGRYRAVVLQSPAGRGFVAVILADGKTEKKTLKLAK